MEQALFSLWQQSKIQEEQRELAFCNEKTEKFGLVLSAQERKELILCRNNSLRKYGRIEFGKGILERLIYEFCDSQFLEQETYGETLQKLQDIFYEFKEETEDVVTDDELLHFMREQFDKICFGDLDYLENTCMVRFFFAGDTVLKAQQKIEAIIRMLISKMWKEESVDFVEAYFAKQPMSTQCGL